MLRPHAPEFREGLGSPVAAGLEENKTGHKLWQRLIFKRGTAPMELTIASLLFYLFTGKGTYAGRSKAKQASDPR